MMGSGEWRMYTYNSKKLIKQLCSDYLENIPMYKLFDKKSISKCSIILSKMKISRSKKSTHIKNIHKIK